MNKEEEEEVLRTVHLLLNCLELNKVPNFIGMQAMLNIFVRMAKRFNTSSVDMRAMLEDIYEKYEEL